MPGESGRPRLLDRTFAEPRLQRWAQLPEQVGDRKLARFLRATATSPLRTVIEAIFGASPFLGDLLLRDPTALRDYVERGPDLVVADELRRALGLSTDDRPALMRALRSMRRRVVLATALADLDGTWSLAEATSALTRFADSAIQVALRNALHEAHRRQEIEVAEPERSGFIVLGMGKLGALELNYSSDIDLICLFDGTRLRVKGDNHPMAVAVRLARAIAYVLEERTSEGFVARVDYRLRPHPPGHPLALSTEDAEIYYERHGQNWERAALIKARPVAGDIEAGRRFLAALQPFLWRKHLDFAAIADIHSIKRQINAHRGFARIAVRGHDVKVGRGGIREIEFFAQTQQLILGGRHPELRGAQTVATLEALAKGGWIDRGAARELIRAYRFLRHVEHRLQLIDDRQTQRLPATDPELRRLAGLLGMSGAAVLMRRLQRTFETVEKHYAALFERAPDLGAGGSLVFTGTGDDPETLENLTRLGFRDPSLVSERIRAWHHGHIRATRSARARELLTELVPTLFEGLARQADPDSAFRLFDEFLTGLPSGVQVFSLFRANPRLLALICDITGAAPRLAAHLGAHPDLLDALLLPGFFEPLPDRGELAAELAGLVRDARDLQDRLDATRRWAHARQFQAGLHVLLGVSTAERVAQGLTDIAEICIGTLLEACEVALAERHGRVPDGRFVVLALGKLGSRELTEGSDLDLIFIYDAPDGAISDGPRPLDAPLWFARLGQRLVSAVTTSTAEGRLYEIDMRLRPSGNAGPLASPLAAFAAYQRHTAQTWEHQALTRARVVAGDPGLAREVERAIRKALLRPRDPDALAQEIAQMRARILKEHGSEDPWNLKHHPGGLVTIEFLAQWLELRSLPLRRRRETATGAMLAAARDAGLLPVDEAERLLEALTLLQRLQAVLRLSGSEGLTPASARPALVEALCRAAALESGAPPPADLATLQRRLVESETAVRHLFSARLPEGWREPAQEEHR
jgi:glutamate-ammonia-ligase adenylyltransferase